MVSTKMDIYKLEFNFNIIIVFNKNAIFRIENSPEQKVSDDCVEKCVEY